MNNRNRSVNKAFVLLGVIAGVVVAVLVSGGLKAEPETSAPISAIQAHQSDLAEVQAMLRRGN